MAGDNRHVPLLRLAEAWASDAGMPPEMVLSNLCDWVMVGAFPDGTLVTAVGDRVDPFDIYMSGKRISAGVARVTVNGWELLNPEWGIGLLAGVLVPERGVRAFCKDTNTAVPSILLSGFERFFSTAR